VSRIPASFQTSFKPMARRTWAAHRELQAAGVESLIVAPEAFTSGIETGADFRSFFPYRLSVSRSSRGARKHTQPFQK
jgi:predicted amidohydrolase